ncbi:hypothetical protein J3F83DRAFT_713937 [Trichoderma novae-zelandiae]
MPEARMEMLEAVNNRIDHEIIDVHSRYPEAEQGLEHKVEELEERIEQAVTKCKTVQRELQV